MVVPRDGRRTVIVDVISDNDSDFLANLLDRPVPPGFFACSAAVLPGCASAGLEPVSSLQSLMSVKIARLDPKVVVCVALLRLACLLFLSIFYLFLSLTLQNATADLARVLEDILQVRLVLSPSLCGACLTA